MKMKSLIIIILSFFLLNFCSTIKDKDITGVYVSKNNLGNELIRLNKDSTFSYKCQLPLLESESKGFWTFNNNLIVLNSYEEFKNDYFEVEELNQDSDFPTIKIVDENNNGITGVNLKINNNISNTLISDLHGNINDDSINLRKDVNITIYSIDLSLGNGKYFIKNDSIKSLIIKIYRKTNEKKYFFNDSLKLKSEKLFFNDLFFKKIK